jgi:hypothetical protein
MRRVAVEALRPAHMAARGLAGAHAGAAAGVASPTPLPPGAVAGARLPSPPAWPAVPRGSAPQAVSRPGQGASGRTSESRRSWLLAGVLALAAGPASAQDPSFRLVNGGSVPIVEIRASPASDPAWGDNRLPRGAALAPGGAFIVRLPPGDCVVDVRVVYATGQAQERRQVNACPILEMVFP